MKTTPHDPVFPFEHPADFITVNGLTKREYFAAMAMQGILANSKSGEVMNFSTMANTAIQLADTLIDELNKKSA